jgi:hypothetical protein
MTRDDALLLEHLQALEGELHNPAARRDATRLNALLHEDYLEFGRSGSAYTKADILSRLPAEAPRATVVADGFVLQRLAEDVALLTYRSAHLLGDGTLDRLSRRASIWQRMGLSWQMRFHQGTPTALYERENGPGN